LIVTTVCTSVAVIGVTLRSIGTVGTHVLVTAISAGVVTGIAGAEVRGVGTVPGAVVLGPQTLGTEGPLEASGGG